MPCGANSGSATTIIQTFALVVNIAVLSWRAAYAIAGRFAILTSSCHIRYIKWVDRGSTAIADVYGHVGHAISKYRTAAGLSQAALANAIGLTRTSISNIEQGRQKMLVHTLVDIAASLSVPVESLLPTAEANISDRDRTFTGSDISPVERATISAILDASARSGRSS